MRYLLHRREGARYVVHMNTTEVIYKATSAHPCPSFTTPLGERLNVPCGANTIPPTPGTDEEGYYCPTCGLLSE